MLLSSCQPQRSSRQLQLQPARCGRLPPPPPRAGAPPPPPPPGALPRPANGGLSLQQTARLTPYPPLTQLFRLVTGLSAGGAGRGAGAGFATYSVDKKITDGMMGELKQKGPRFQHIAALHAKHKGQLL